MNANQYNDWCAATLGKALEGALHAMTNEPVSVTAQTAGQSGAGDGEWIWWSQLFNGLPAPGILLGGTVDSWNNLGREILGPVGTDATSADFMLACQDLLTQSAETVAEEATRTLDDAVSLKDIASAEIPNDGDFVELSIAFAAQVVKLIAVFPEPLRQRLTDPESARRGQARRSDAPSHLSTCEFPLYVKLGQTSLPLRELFKMTVGSVIELGQLTSDPVDIVVNGRVIAHGQVVVSSGSYGVKITSRPSR